MKEGSTKNVPADVLKEVNSLIAPATAVIAYEEDDPELLVGIDEIKPPLALAEGTKTLKDRELILGSEEGIMMKEEGEYARIGDKIDNFLGAPDTTVIGILQPTGTVLDFAHIVSDLTFGVIGTGTVVTSLPDEGSLKLFALVGSKSVIPSAFRSIITPFSLEPRLINEKRTTPIFVGWNEAQMMINKGLFTNQGDIIDDFFGNRVIIAGILPRTGTILDQFHYIPASLNVK